MDKWMDKWMIALYGVVSLIIMAFWGTVFYVAWHFISRHW